MPIVGRMQIMVDPEVIVPALILPDPTVNVQTPIVFYNNHPSTIRVIVKRSYPESVTVTDRYISANTQDVFIDTVPFSREQIIQLMSGGEAVIAVTYDIELYEFNPATNAYDKFVGVITTSVSFRFIDPPSWDGTVVEHVEGCRSGSSSAITTTEFGEEVGVSPLGFSQRAETSTVLVPLEACSVGSSGSGTNYIRCFVYTINNLVGTRCYLVLYFKKNKKFSIYVSGTGRGLPGFVTGTLSSNTWYGVGLKLVLPSSNVIVCPIENLGSGERLLYYDEWWVVCK